MVLNGWVEMIHVGKINASRGKALNEKNDAWAMHSYGQKQVDTAVDAFHLLVDAIKTRIPASALLTVEQGPMLTDDDLDMASVPTECFIMSFLTRVRNPRFQKIAPGLIVPHAPAAFAASQRLTKMGINFSVEEAALAGMTDVETTNLDRCPSSYAAHWEKPDSFVTFNPFCSAYHSVMKRGDYSTPAGLCSESVDRSSVDQAEEGFRLLLSFLLRPLGDDAGARRSDG
ncbi:hypothetical protein VSDG_05884 [Cytospora chrysosperma]|uniref:Uncharacterized protein n=1 Tax=Cytospora chrysosperma TaxID=252740 RepID=A0A423VTN3_CYTCH|nr:hypothetical protein VSDG_05884 [Valsa sordida]